MTDQPRLLYLEPDDEITSLVRRLGEEESGRVIVVVPGRSRATSSLVALRLLARAGSEAGRELAIVADPATRALADEAGLPAFATLTDAISGTSTASAAAPRAPIRVVRGARHGSTGVVAPSPRETAPTQPPAGPVRPLADDVTVAVQLPPANAAMPPARARATGAPSSRRGPRLRLAVLALALVVVGVAALLPGATVRIAPASVAVGPVRFTVTIPAAGHRSGQLAATQNGTATGERLDQIAAKGTVVFSNWNAVAVAVPAGTQVSVQGGPAFTTDKRIVVPKGHVSGPSSGSVGVTATTGGPAGNVAAGAIDTIDDSSVRARLRLFSDNLARLVNNPDATTGGSETKHVVIQQSDVDALATVIDDDLAAQLATQLGSVQDAVYATTDPAEQPTISIPPDLVGTEDQPAFSLTGTLAYDRPYALLADVEAAARQQFTDNPPAIPTGTAIGTDSIQVQIESATAAGDSLNALVRISAVASNSIDATEIRDRIAGLSVAAARDALSDFGDVRIDLWPPWVDHLPQIGFRISVETVEQQPGAR